MALINSYEDCRKVLFLWLNDQDFHAENSFRRGIRTARIYKECSFFAKIMRKIHIVLRIPGVSLWFDKWKLGFKVYDTIIVHASTLSPAVVDYIRKKNKNVRIIVWYWNPVEKCVKPCQFAKYNVELWSFDEKDCNNYKLNHNTQYYFNDISLSVSENEFDIFFVGGDKGRMQELMEFQNKITQLGLLSYFHVTSDSRFEVFSIGKRNKFAKYYKERIAYHEVVEYIGKSKAILDYVSDGQTGLTLRPLEALFFRKKMITNDKSISDRDFYNENNIFIIGKDELSELPFFLSSPYVEVGENIRDRYDFNQWLNRFLKIEVRE